MKRFTIYIDDELERKLSITAEGHKTCIENYIIQVLELDMKDTEQRISKNLINGKVYILLIL